MNPRRRSRHERPRHGRRNLVAYRRSVAQHEDDRRPKPRHVEVLSPWGPKVGYRRHDGGWESSRSWWRRIGRPVERLRKDFDGEPQGQPRAEAPNLLRRAQLRVARAIVPGIRFDELSSDLRRQANADAVDELRGHFKE